MSRIGKLPIVIPAGVTVTISGNEVKVKGPKGELVQTVSPEIKVEMVDGEIHVTRPNDELYLICQRYKFESESQLESYTLTALLGCI